jgi:hypothetical protein
MAFAIMKMISFRIRDALKKSTAAAAKADAAGKDSAAQNSPAPPHASSQAVTIEETDGDAQVLRRVLMLQKMDIFSNLAHRDFVRLALAADEITFRKGQDICREGDYGDTMYGIIQGSVRVHSGDTTFARLAAGSFFGEMAVIDSGRRSASCTALEDTTVMALGQDEFRFFCVESAGVIHGLLKVLSERLSATMRQV